MNKLTFKDTTITNNNHFKEKTLCGGDTGAGGERNSGRKKRKIVQEGGKDGRGSNCYLGSPT